MSESPIRVLIAEDSPTVRRHLVMLINETSGLVVVGEARDGEEAVMLTGELKPDVISMDIRMPGMDGLEATRRIMSRLPTPVVIVSGLVERDVDLSFQAVQAGALAVVEKPPDRRDPTFHERQRQMVTTLAAMARVRVVRRWENMPILIDGGSTSTPGARISTGRLRLRPEIIAVGSSAGGPSALRVLLRDLPAAFPAPIVVVQHMPDEFISGLARWLNKATALGVRVASNNLVLEPGMVYLAPGSAHLAVARYDNRLAAQFIYDQGTHRHQPSVDVLFDSVARVCGSASVGIVLTGMGDDGAVGLLAMRQAGALTLAQDEDSSTVFGMPRAAAAKGGVEHMLALSNLATTLSRLSLL
jgi:two-component system, chemotaxis family, protein-glutamate methylesterase/glutaminase